MLLLLLLLPLRVSPCPPDVHPFAQGIYPASHATYEVYVRLGAYPTRSAYDEKHVVSPGPLGGFGAQHAAELMRACDEAMRAAGNAYVIQYGAPPGGVVYIGISLVRNVTTQECDGACACPSALCDGD